MKIKFLAVILLTTLAGPAFAETVKDHYKEVIEQTPYSVEVCKDVTVPGKKNTEGAIFGGILGGVLGNQFGNGDGKTAMTGVGAITGAILGGGNGSPSTTQRQCQVETRYEETRRKLYSHSTVTFYNEGKKHTLKFQK